MVVFIARHKTSSGVADSKIKANIYGGQYVVLDMDE